MPRVLSSELSQAKGQKVLLKGWLNNLRALGKLNFLILRDRMGLVQVVITEKSELQKIAPLQIGTILTVEGTVSENGQVEGGFEIVDPLITVEVPITEPPPLEYYKPTIPTDLEMILDHRSLSLRNRRIQAVFRIQAELVHAYRLFMHDKAGAVEYFAPNILGASSEGGAEFFNVDYFGYTATLAQSSQLYKQMMVGVNERVFALMPFFRAEPSHTPRHIAEGKQFEFEMGFFDNWQEILDLQEACLKYMVKHLHQHCPKEVALFDMAKVPENIPLPRLTFKEAQELYFERTGVDERKEPDLSPAAERELCAWSFEKHGTDCLFVIDWMTEKRPFYAYPKEDNPKLTNTMDLLCGGVEISSGGERRHTYESMVEGLLLKGMNPEGFADYLAIFKHGMPCHGGFGMGLERLTMTLLRLKNIREASLFPSDSKRIAGQRIKAKIFFGEENIRNEIIRLLKDNQMAYQHLIHEATPTSEDSSRVRGTAIETGIKALILRGKQSKKNVQVCLPANRKVDMKAVAERVGEKCEFEDPGVILERFGLQIGGIPPFGNLLNIDTYFDESIKGACNFNCGLMTESLAMQSEDLLRLVQPKVGAFAKAD